MANETRAKIIQAVIDEVEDVGLQVTVDQIAERAGVNSLTLFRHFGSKQQLIITAIEQMLGPIANAKFEPSNNVHNDFAMIVTKYTQMIDEHPGVFVQILSTTDPALLRSIVLPLQQHIATSLTKLIDFYKQRNELADIPNEDLIRELMGPLLARAFLRNTLPIKPLDINNYVQRSLRLPTTLG